MSTFGEELRRERELREISLREVAEATKINLRYLEALESNEFEHLPGGFYNKSIVREYCKHIGVDPEDMVNAYLLEERAQFERGGGDDGLLRGGRADAVASERPARRPGPVVWVVLALILAGLLAAVYLYTRLDAENGKESPGSTWRLERNERSAGGHRA